MKRKIIYFLYCSFVISSFALDISITDHKQRDDGSKLWDIWFTVSECSATDTVDIFFEAVTTLSETLTVSSFVLPSDTGFVVGPGDYHALWNIGIDEPEHEFKNEYIILFVSAYIHGIDPGICCDILYVDGGVDHSLILRIDGTVFSMGDNTFGQLGIGSLIDEPTPEQVLGLESVGFLAGISKISCGYYHNLAVTTDSTAFSWGKNHRGQLGINSAGGISDTYTPLYDRNVPVYVMDAYDTLAEISNIENCAGGKNHSAILEYTNSMFAFGYNRSGQLGIDIAGGDDDFDEGIDMDSPTRVLDPTGASALTNIVQISSGAYHTCALTSDGTVFCWGANYWGQLGNGDSGGDAGEYDEGIDRQLPVQVSNSTGTGNLANIVKISCGSFHTLAVDRDGQIWTWGRNECGQLGDNSRTTRDRPVRVRQIDGTGSIDNIMDVRGGEFFSMALDSTGRVLTWGDNHAGQLGVNTSGGVLGEFNPAHDSSIPQYVVGTDGTGNLEDILLIGCGLYHALAVGIDGTIYSWGLNESGQLGDDSYVNRNRPVLVITPW